MKVSSDISLVARVAAFNDKRAFNELVKKYQSPVRRFFMSHTLGDKELSDDLAQETFIKAYMNIGKFRNLSGFSTWLFSIAYRVLIDDVRARRHTDDIDSSTAANRGKATNEELRMDIYRCLGLLQPDERTCITLQLIEGQTIEHIAKITGMPPGTVKSHLSRGKSKLALFLKRNGYDGQ